MAPCIMAADVHIMPSRNKATMNKEEVMPEVIEVMPVAKRGRKESYTELYKFFNDLNYEGIANNGPNKGNHYESGFGKAVKLTKGNDYHCETVSMRASLYRIAEANGCNVTVVIPDDDSDAVMFQAVSLEIIPKVKRRAKHA